MGSHNIRARFTAIPNIQEGLMNNQGLNDGIFWTPQVIGGTGFMISASVPNYTSSSFQTIDFQVILGRTFIMLEAQNVWWKPTITSLGWQVGGMHATYSPLCISLLRSSPNFSMEFHWCRWIHLVRSLWLCRNDEQRLRIRECFVDFLGWLGFFNRQCHTMV